MTRSVPEFLPSGDALAKEVELLRMVSEDSGRRFIWLWSSPQALVSPRKLAAKPLFSKVSAESLASGWPVETRSTGGDVTPQGPGIINVTHAYTAPSEVTFDLEREYARLCTPIETALGPEASRGWMPGAFCDGAHNVQFRGRKFAGTAMRFRPSRTKKSRYAVMAHALMLMTAPGAATIEALNKFLNDLGEARTIDIDAHTGLPDDLPQDIFLERLVAAIADDPELPVKPLKP